VVRIIANMGGRHHLSGINEEAFVYSVNAALQQLTFRSKQNVTVRLYLRRKPSKLVGSRNEKHVRIAD
jgi:hypothetical protein